MDDIKYCRLKKKLVVFSNYIGTTYFTSQKITVRQNITKPDFAHMSLEVQRGTFIDMQATHIYIVKGAVSFAVQRCACSY